MKKQNKIFGLKYLEKSTARHIVGSWNENLKTNDVSNKHVGVRVDGRSVRFLLRDSRPHAGKALTRDILVRLHDEATWLVLSSLADAYPTSRSFVMQSRSEHLPVSA